MVLDLRRIGYALRSRHRARLYGKPCAEIRGLARRGWALRAPVFVGNAKQIRGGNRRLCSQDRLVPADSGSDLAVAAASPPWLIGWQPVYLFEYLCQATYIKCSIFSGLGISVKGATMPVTACIRAGHSVVCGSPGLLTLPEITDAKCRRGISADVSRTCFFCIATISRSPACFTRIVPADDPDARRRRRRRRRRTPLQASHGLSDLVFSILRTALNAFDIFGKHACLDNYQARRADSDVGQIRRGSEQDQDRAVKAGAASRLLHTPSELSKFESSRSPRRASYNG